MGGGNNESTVHEELVRGTTANAANGEGLEERDGDHSNNERIGRMPSGFELAVSFAACDSVEAQARTECRPSPEDVALWRQELEQVAEVVPPSPPNGAVWTDIAGATFGLALAMVARGRVRLQLFRATH